MYPIRVLGKRLAVLFLIYFLSRGVFYFFYTGFFSASSASEIILAFIYGLRFDASSIVYSNLIFIFLHIFPWSLFYKEGYQRILRSLFYIFNVPCFFFASIDLAYFRFPLKRTTFDIFHAIFLGDDIRNTLPHMVEDYWYVLVFFAAFTALAGFLYNRISILQDSEVTKEPLFRRFVIFCLGIGACIVLARGGFQRRPLGLMHAASNSPANSQLILNTPFSIMLTYGKSEITDEGDFIPGEGSDTEKKLEKKFTRTGEFKNYNVVLIILESMSKEYIGALTGNHGYTPFLDSLINESYVCTEAFANGKRSIEGIPSILASLPALMNEPFITSTYWGNSFNSIASVLKEKNYSTTFYHGGTNGTLGFDNFCRAAGFDRYFGRTEFNNDEFFDGTWGIYDHAFFAAVAEDLKKTQRPFLGCLFSLSSHDPYHIPKGFDGKFTKGNLPIYECIQYTDYSLRKLFESLSKETWFDSTLFIITGDHTGPSETPSSMNNIGKFKIPILYYLPHSKLKRRDETVTQQADILPSILDFLNYNRPFYTFGESVFDSSTEHYAVNFHNDLYQLVQEGKLLSFAKGEALGLFDYKKDTMLQSNLLKADQETGMKMTNKLKSIVRRYQSGMKNNSLKKP